MRKTNDKDIFEEYNYQNDIHYSYENKNYLQNQLITYIGNKRKLLSLIDNGIRYCQKRFNKKKMRILDGFSGSGVVSRNLKQYSTILYSNDLELYSYIINSCYLFNKSEIDIPYILECISYLNNEKNRTDLGVGTIEKLYAPKDDNNIKKEERVFYTNQNAKIIDNIRRTIDKKIPQKYHHFFIAPLLSEASIHTNTSGVFKGFYKNSKTKTGQFGGNDKNCLSRIKQIINLPVPLFSDHDCKVVISQKDIKVVLKEIDEVEVAYFDPPYNQHPYGSNYFMLNVISSYKEPKMISKISGIPKQWNKSDYNKKDKAIFALEELINNTPSKIILLSYNEEGIITISDIIDVLGKYGKIEVMTQQYTVFRASRNLKNRTKSLKEYLFILEK